MQRPRPRRRSLAFSAGAGVVVLSALLSAGAMAASETDVDTVGAQLVCYCGCSGQTVEACTCGTADQIRDRIRSQLDSGLSPDEVVAEWVAERGEQVLAVPTREGFNLVGWIMPFVVTLAGLVTLTLFLMRWRRQHAASLPAKPEENELTDEEKRYLGRIEEGVRTLRD